MGQHIYTKSRAKFLLLHHQTSKETLLGDLPGVSNEVLGDSEWCWTALQYTKQWMSSTTPALKDLEGNAATSLDEKAKMIQMAVFPPLPPLLAEPIGLDSPNNAYQLPPCQPHFALLS